jgi:hypothetical protein
MPRMARTMKAIMSHIYHQMGQLIIHRDHTTYAFQTGLTFMFFHQSLSLRSLAFFLNTPALCWSSSACCSILSNLTQLLRATLMLSCMVSLTASTFFCRDASLSTSCKLLYLRQILSNNAVHVMSNALSLAVVALCPSTLEQN